MRALGRWMVYWLLVMVLQAAPAPDSRRLAVIPPGHVVGGQRLQQLGASVGPVTVMRYAATWDQLIVGGDLGTLQIFQGSDLSLVQGGNAGDRITALTHVEQLNEVIAGGVDGRMIFLQSSNLQSLATVNENSGGSQVNAIVYVFYSDDVTSYSEVASSSYFTSNIQLWSANAKTKTRELPGHSNIVLSLAFLGELQMLVSGSLDGFLGLWSLPLARLQADGQICAGSTLSPLQTSYLLEDCISAVLQVANPAGGDFFIYGQAGSSSANECQMLENVGTCSSLVAAPYTMYRLQPALRHMVQAHGGPVRAIERVPQQGTLVASGGDDGTIRTWNPTTGAMVRDFGDGEAVLDSGVTALAYSSTLEALVAATLLQIVFFDVSSGSILSTIDRSTSSPALVLTMDSHQLVLSSKGTEMEVWPQLTLCADGSAPSSFSQCDECIPPRAGVGGFCDEVCGPGTESTGTQCVQCSAGQAGDGTSCQDCLPGEFQELPGQISCQQCPRGFAQPSSRQTSCEDCIGNTAAVRPGSEVCVACPDSTEPSVDHTECITCVQGSAGRGGVCQACLDGQQNSADSTVCLDCAPGSAGTLGFCSLCAAGTEPNPQRTLCVPCALGFAGSLGICERCGVGEEPDAASALCVPCPVGRAGLNGTCSLCPVGTVQSEDRSICIFCPEGEIATQARCEICPDGQMPNDNRSICLTCPPGYAGTSGFCSLCPKGTGASGDHSSCDQCPAGFYGAEGFCSQCANGTQPRNVSEDTEEGPCVPCPARFAGGLGLCQRCPDGSEPLVDRSDCQTCPIGTAGVGGECHACDFPLMQDENRTSCSLQLTSPLFLFAASRCGDHACRQHFAHLDVDHLFCCPTPEGVALACCDFMSQDSGLSELLAQGFDFVMTLSDSLVVTGAALGASLCILALVLCWIWKSSSWMDWRENVRVSALGLVFSLLLLAVVVASFPWILGTMLAFFFPAFVVAFAVFAGMHLLLLRILRGFQPMLRTMATKRLRVLLYAIGDSIMSSIMLLGDWIIVHFLLADLVSSICFVLGQSNNFVRPIAYEYVISTLPVPEFLGSITMLVVRLLWSMQVSLSSLPMQIAIRATPAAGIMAAASLTYTTTIFCYILMSSDLAARLMAAKHAVMVGDLTLPGQIYRLFLVGFLEFFLHVLLRFAAGWPARLAPFVATILLAPPPGVSSWNEDFIPVVVALFCAATAEIFVLCTWLWLVGSRRQSTHLGNPPHFLVRLLRWVSRDRRLHFEESRAEEYLVCGVLRVLGLWHKEEDVDGPPSARNSPRSPRSGRSGATSPSSPGATSGRRSPVSSRSAGAGGVKLKKNLASVTALLRRATGTSGSPNNSPRGSPDSSPRAAAVVPRFVRLADGSLMELNQRAREARSARSPGRSPGRSPRSPGRGDSPRSPGRGARGARGRHEEHPDGEDATSQGSGEAKTDSRRDRCKKLLMQVLKLLFHWIQRCCSPVTRRVKKCLPSGPKKTSARKVLQRAGRVIDRVPEEAKKDAAGLIDLWEDLAELSGAQVDLTQLAVLPRALYNAVPKPKVKLFLRQGLLRICDSMKVIAWTLIGWWKQEANLGPLRVRLRCRELIQEVGRRHIDQEDYKAAQISTANSVAILLLWLPGCAVLSLLARYCNAPPVRNLDDTVDIVKQKIKEYMDKGSNQKEAELAVRKLLGERRGGRLRSVYVARARRLQSSLGMCIATSSLFMVSPVVMSEPAVKWAAPIFFTLTFALVSFYVLMDRVVVPWVAPKKMLMLSVLRETREEIKVMEDILETYRNMPKEEEEVSSEDGDASSDYSSANESFLDEDPQSTNDPDVLGSKQVKILVRPKAARLRMRFQLMRSLPRCGEHLMRYQREEPLKYGRLLRVPGYLPTVQMKAARTTRARYTRRTMVQVQPKGAAREARSYSFSPTLNSDTQHKEKVFNLRRCHSLATGVAFEGKVEERMLRDHWEMHADIFDEHSRPGLPAMPQVAEKMPHRGLVDQFEAVGTFKGQTETKTLRELASKGLFTDTSLGDRVMKAFTAVTGIETRTGGLDPWQVPVDEALDGYEKQFQAAQRPAPRLEEELNEAMQEEDWSDQSAEE